MDALCPRLIAALSDLWDAALDAGDLNRMRDIDQLIEIIDDLGEDGARRLLELVGGA